MQLQNIPEIKFSRLYLIKRKKGLLSNCNGKASDDLTK